MSASCSRVASLAFLLSALLGGSLAAQQAPAAPSAPAAPPAAVVPVDVSHLPAIDAAALKSRVETLASDAMAGRETGSPGGQAAAKYLAAELAKAGLQPAGDAGGFLQVIDRVGFALDGAPELSWT